MWCLPHRVWIPALPVLPWLLIRSKYRFPFFLYYQITACFNLSSCGVWGIWKCWVISLHVDKCSSVRSSKLTFLKSVFPFMCLHDVFLHKNPKNAIFISWHRELFPNFSKLNKHFVTQATHIHNTQTNCTALEAGLMISLLVLTSLLHHQHQRWCFSDSLLLSHRMYHLVARPLSLSFQVFDPQKNCYKFTF